MIADFAESLCRGGAPSRLTAWNGSAPDQRFAVYRNNVAVSLREALAAKYPLIMRLVGEEYFAALANEYRAAHPPHAPRLALYGDEFGAFIEHFPPLGAWPFLADVARLEAAWLQAYHAKDVAPLQASSLGARADLADLRFRLHPSLRLVWSEFPIVSLAARLAAGETLAEFDMDHPQTALIARPHMDVVVLSLSASEATFVSAISRQATVADAAGAALSLNAAFDAGVAFRNLFERGLVAAIASEEQTP